MYRIKSNDYRWNMLQISITVNIVQQQTNTAIPEAPNYSEYYYYYATGMPIHRYLL